MGCSGGEAPREKNAVLGNDLEILGNEKEIVLNDMFMLGIKLSARPILVLFRFLCWCCFVLIVLFEFVLLHWPAVINCNILDQICSSETLPRMDTNTKLNNNATSPNLSVATVPCPSCVNNIGSCGAAHWCRRFEYGSHTASSTKQLGSKLAITRSSKQSS